MIKEIKQYLKNLEKEDKYKYFILYRFYLNPSLSLSDSDISYLFDNDKFFYFLSLCFNDSIFISKLDDKTLKILRGILYTRQIASNKDVNLINSLLYRSVDLDIKYYVKNIVPNIEKKRIIDTIIKDDYSNYEGCYLYSRHGNDRESFVNLVCDNDFLGVIKTYLLEYNLSNEIIDSIIDILVMGIDYKFRRFYYFNFEERYQLLGQKKISVFNDEEAFLLIKKLEEKRAKIVNFVKEEANLVGKRKKKGLNC